MTPVVSIVIPVLDEQESLPSLMAQLSSWRDNPVVEILVVDGGSVDGTADALRGAGYPVLSAPRGRASQMNAGAALARGDILLFLHADTLLPVNFAPLRLAELCTAESPWGRFDVAISGEHPLLPVIAWAMNLRSRLTGIATGDQGIFVRRDLFNALGGYPDQPLMEDIALSGMLGKHARPLCLSHRLVTSGRHWQRRGLLRTVWLMWWLRLAYRCGASPETLARRYYPRHREDRPGAQGSTSKGSTSQGAA